MKINQFLIHRSGGFERGSFVVGKLAASTMKRSLIAGSTLFSSAARAYGSWSALSGFALILAVAIGFAMPSDAHAISIYILNKQKLDEPGAVLEVTSVKGVGVSGNQKMLIMPGERKHVYARHVTGFVLGRVFGDYKLLYEVKCPEDMRIKDILNISLENVEKNTVGAGCDVYRKGRWTLESGTAWQPTKK